MLAVKSCWEELKDRPKELTRRDFLRGAEAVVLAAVLNRAYAHVSPEDVARDEDFWKGIRGAYGSDPKILNLNNGGVAPSPATRPDARDTEVSYKHLTPA